MEGFKIFNKQFMDNNFKIINVYNDTDPFMKRKITMFLIKCYNKLFFIDFIDSIYKDIKEKKYFIQTEINYNYERMSFQHIKETLIYYKAPEYIYNYLISFFEYIKNEYKIKKEYLYRTNYSLIIFNLFINMILRRHYFLNYNGNLIMGHNDLFNLTINFINMLSDLKKYKLFLKMNKTKTTNTVCSSIYFVDTVISVPKNNVLDKYIKDILLDKIEKEKKIKIYDYNIHLYRFLRNNIKDKDIILDIIKED